MHCESTQCDCAFIQSALAYNQSVCFSVFFFLLDKFGAKRNAFLRMSLVAILDSSLARVHERWRREQRHKTAVKRMVYFASSFCVPWLCRQIKLDHHTSLSGFADPWGATAASPNFGQPSRSWGGGCCGILLGPAETFCKNCPKWPRNGVFGAV